MGMSFSGLASVVSSLFALNIGGLEAIAGVEIGKGWVVLCCVALCYVVMKLKLKRKLMLVLMLMLMAGRTSGSGGCI